MMYLIGVVLACIIHTILINVNYKPYKWVVGSLVWYPMRGIVKRKIEVSTDRRAVNHYIDLLTDKYAFTKHWYGRKYMKMCEDRIEKIKM